MCKYLLSIIIPTRNRQEYLIKTLEEICLEIPKNIQIVIQDNSDYPSLQHEKIIVDNSFVKYSYTNEQLSFVANFCEAIDAADGKYICVLGDDDGVTREIYSAVEFANSNGIEAIVPRIDFEYFYPGSIKWKNEDSDGIIRLLSEKVVIKRIYPEDSLVKFLKSGCINYTQYDLVKLYHGIVLKDKLEIIKEYTGNYINGLTPDIYSAVALSMVCKKVYKISFPLTIAGVCPRSGSADSSNGRHVGRYEDAPHLDGHDIYQWSSLVPKFYSVETIWADSALAAVNDLNRDDLLKHFSPYRLKRYCIFLYGDYERKYICGEGSNVNDNKLRRVLCFPLGEYKNKIFRRVSRVPKRLYIIHGISDIVAANNEFSKYREKYMVKLGKASLGAFLITTSSEV